MTKISTTKEFDCVFCKKKHTITVYNSVNIGVNPELREKVINEEINTFPCKESNGTLIFKFLYVEGNFWVWIYPEFHIDKEEKIIAQIQKQTEMLKKTFGSQGKIVEPYLVFGYRGFFKLIKKIIEEGKENKE